MKGHSIRKRARAATFALLVGLLAAVSTPSAQARPIAPQPTVELSSAARLAPNGQSLEIDLTASCPDRWTVVEAVVTVTQPQASGQGSFPLTCIGSIRPFTVTVQSTRAAFQLGEAQATASVVISRGRTEQAQDSQTVQVEPTVEVDLADTALLLGGGEAVLIDVTVACPVGATGQQSNLVVSQGQVYGTGSYVPTCDGQRHTFSVTAQASQGLFQPGSAQALTFAFVEAGGNSFSGVDDGPIEIVMS
jgi:hypothetical protein